MTLQPTKTPRILSIRREEITISKNRQRKEFRPEDTVSLAGSISEFGLMNPVTIRRGDNSYILVAGERRIRALETLWNFGEEVRCGDFSFPENIIPCIDFGELDPLDAFALELEENVRRIDLSWIEKSEASAKLLDFRKAKAKRDGVAEPTIDDIAREVRGDSSTAREQTRKEVLVSKHLDDPEVRKAKSADEAFKLLKRREELARSAALAAEVGVTFTNKVHDLRQGNCMELLPEYAKESFDILLTDPPYGIDADRFSDSGGLAQGSHFYDDSWTYWNKLCRFLAAESFRVCKPQSHAYVFCDIDNFVLLKGFFMEAGWKVFRTPIVWVNPTASRAPWPEHGPQRKYQICMFAIKGNRPVLALKPDVVSFPSDDNLNHQAQKPVALYQELLSRSARPGDSVLDCFGGTGTILPAAHALKCKATYMELDQAAYGIALQRLAELN